MIATLPQSVRLRLRHRARTRWRDPVLIVAALVGVGLVVMVIAAPWLAPEAPQQTNILAPNAPASAQHLLGTDALGRDLLSRLMYGGRLSLLAPALVVVIATTVGTALAVSAAWFGGAFDSSVTRVMNILFSFPSLILAVLAVAAFGSGVVAPVLALSVAYIPYVGRVARSLALRERNLPYVEALVLAGVPTWKICAGHITANLLPVIRAQALIAFGSALVDFGAISFLGLGVQPPTAEWGLMVADGRSALLSGTPQESLYAGGFIVLTVVALNVVGERLAARAEMSR
ncbi:MAG: gsiD 1 [Actinomycetia bacterium]|nr:gsiD 1 [Actinomycetes bacterium]